jgi:hypothetical protein
MRPKGIEGNGFALWTDTRRRSKGDAQAVRNEGAELQGGEEEVHYFDGWRCQPAAGKWKRQGQEAGSVMGRRRGEEELVLMRVGQRSQEFLGLVFLAYQR